MQHAIRLFGHGHLAYVHVGLPVLYVDLRHEEKRPMMKISNPKYRTPNIPIPVRVPLTKKM